MTKPLSHLVLALLVAQSCDAAIPHDWRCVFSIEVTADSDNGSSPSGGTLVGDHIIIYENSKGILYAEGRDGWHFLGESPQVGDWGWGGGEEFTNRIRDAFKQAQLNNFDFDARLADAKAHLTPPEIRSVTLLGGVSEKGVMTALGGTTVKVHADLEGTRFDFECKSFKANLDYYSAYNIELKRLKTLMDAIADEYGRSVMPQ